MDCTDSDDGEDLYTDGEPTSKFQSINQSTQIRDGLPKKRLLNTSKETLDDSGEVRRWTFGEKNQSQTRTIMMLGETGTGKSTLINVMVNYILGVEYQDDIRFEIIKEEERSQTESQTTAVTVYEVYGSEGVRVPFSLRLIDTPGYTDTAGVKQDEKIAQNIMKLFKAESGVDQIDAVCLVVKASQNRLTDTQVYIFDAILSLFGKDIEHNIMALITFSDGGRPGALEAIDEAGVPCARNKKKQPIFFKFNNVSKKINDDRGNDDAHDDDDEEGDDDDYLQRNWAMGVANMQKFFEKLATMETRSLQMTQDVLMGRDQLEMSIQYLQDQIIATENLQTMIRQTQDAVEKHKKDIDANKDFDYVVDEPCKIQVDTIYPATCCKVCETTCHHPCTIVSADMLNWCAVMKKHRCTVCEKKCMYQDHIKEKKMYKSSTRPVTRTFEHLKGQYKIASGEKGTAENLMKDLQEALENVMSGKREHIQESYQHVLRLSEIALRPDSRSTLQHLDFLLERLEETGTAEQIQKIVGIKKSAEELNKLK
ncbi:uncharacterized protein LOC133114227 isoform X2 [Conger conger]|uniref:uncharacterized protein LOC133114227 isoform X2 n=1 Tax=Conger conger TaxID=82655 RepID=UPI002A5AB5DB|nr:uncharacterized protein LOC133114227 isoform X2 [Conger conger]